MSKMRTNRKTRKTMPESWIEFFNICYNSPGYNKYFKDDDNRTCAYNTENSDSSVVQVAPRRQRGKTPAYIAAEERELFDKIFGKTTYIVDAIYITCSHRYGGIWIYDEIEMAHNKKRRLIERNGNPYLEVDVNACYKIKELWDLPKCNDRVKYAVARSQYEHMIHENMFDNIKTWEDLPDWCLWKWMEADGSVIEGREQAFEEYKAHTRGLKDYVPLNSVMMEVYYG